MKIPENWRPWLAIICATIAAATGISVAVTDGGNNTISITVQGPAGPSTVVADKDGEAELEQGEKGAVGVHEDMADEKPPGIAPGTAQAIEAKAEKIPTAEPLRPAGAQIHSCKRNYLINRSPRRAKMTLFVVHWGVVPHNDTGLAIMRRLFNDPSFKANSTFGLSPTGRCEQWAAFSDAPYTQLTFNQVSESVEIAAMGNEPRSWWLKQPIIKDGILAALIIDRLRANGLPLRWVDPVGCNPKAGWTDHNALECGNSHCDVNCGHFPYDVVKRQVASGVSSPAARTIDFPRIRNFGPKKRAWCTRLAIIRKNAKADEWTDKRVAVAERYKYVLIGKGLTKPQADKRAVKCKFVQT
jgi:hypothetical protein